MTKEEFIAQLDRAAAMLGALPVTSATLRFLAEDLKRPKEPEWWGLTAKAWQHRRFEGWAEAWSLLLTAMHYEALSSRECPLVPYFPSCGGTADAEPSRGIVKFLNDPPDSFYDNLKNAQRRSFFGGEGSSWALHASIFFGLRNLPFYLVEVGTGGGTHLAADLWSPVKVPADLVAARIGLDRPALALEDLSHRRWLTASMFPDQGGLIAQFDRAADVVLDGKRRDPNFIQLVDCPIERAPKFIAKNIPADDPDVGLLIFNYATTARLSNAEWDQYNRGIVEVMKPWGDRALWVELERVRNELFSMTFEVRVARMVDGAPAQRVTLRADAAANTSENHLDEVVRFLLPAGSTVSADELLKSLQAPAKP